MPCITDNYTLSHADYERMLMHDGKLADMLCSVLQTLNYSEEEMLRFTPKVREWWKEHKRRDEARLQEQFNRAKEKHDKAEALAKLTSYERKLLGIKE